MKLLDHWKFQLMFCFDQNDEQLHCIFNFQFVPRKRFKLHLTIYHFDHY